MKNRLHGPSWRFMVIAFDLVHFVLVRPVPSKPQEMFVMRSRAQSRSVLPLVLALCAFAVVFVSAQDRLRTMPGYEQFQKMQGQTQGAVVSGAVSAAWSADNTSFSYI